MLSLEEARAVILARVTPLDPIVLSLSRAHGRVLRQDIVAPEDAPAFDRSAMDGYAVRLDDDSASFKIVGEVRAGDVPDFGLQRGECARVFTGARLPGQASQVIMQEDVMREGDVMKPSRRIATTHVRQRGEDARAGDVILRSGLRLRAPEMAVLAQAGAVEPVVSPVPRVIHFATGDELVSPEVQPGAGQIRDTNSTLIAGLLTECGAELVHHRRCGDELPTLLREVSAIRESDWDILLISGGASVGDYDIGVTAVRQFGFEVHFHGVNMRPGKPLAFATRGRQVAFVIPGNPVSHFVGFHTAVRLALSRLRGAEPAWPQGSAALAIDLPAATGAREIFWPAYLFADCGRLTVRPLGWRSSGDLCGIATANSLIRIAAGSPSAAAGEIVNCLLLDAC